MADENGNFRIDLVYNFCLAFSEAGGTPAELKKFTEDKILMRDIVALLRREANQETTRSIATVAIDTVVRVDRAILPAYSISMRKVMHPELEGTGPSEYDVGTIQCWLLERQQVGSVKGQEIYDYLLSNSLLEKCLGLRDLEEIKKQGIGLFRKHFGGKAVLAWRSVIEDSTGHLAVPCLVEGAGEVTQSWLWLENDYEAVYPALMFGN